MIFPVEVETESQLRSLSEYLLGAGVEGRHWWTGGTDLQSEGAWLWTSSLTAVGNFIWSPGQPDGAEQQNCLYLNPHYDYTGRDDDCHVRKQPLCQLYIPTTDTPTKPSSTTTSPTSTSTTTTQSTQSSSTTSDFFIRQKCCDTVRLQSSGLISSLMPEYVGAYRKIVTESTNRSIYHKEDKFLFYLDDKSSLETEGWVFSTSMDVPLDETIITIDDDLCADNTRPGWQVLVAGDWLTDETAVVRCERPGGECETDEECNEGLTGVCATDQEGHTVGCQYCQDALCTPGCLHDYGSDQVPRCPQSLPVCNLQTHQCQADPGSTLLQEIVFTSHGCQGCTREGVNMTLTGNEIILPQPKCRTVDLDHPDQVDFKSKSTFVATTEEQDLGWANCWKVRDVSLGASKLLHIPGTTGGECDGVRGGLDRGGNLETSQHLLRLGQGHQQSLHLQFPSGDGPLLRPGSSGNMRPSRDSHLLMTSAYTLH